MDCEKRDYCDNEDEWACAYDNDCETCKAHGADVECGKCDTCTYQM